MIFWESWEASIKTANCAYNSCDIQQHLFLFSLQHKNIIENQQFYMAQYQSRLFPALYSCSKVCIISSSPQHTSLISHRHLKLKSASQIVYTLWAVHLPWARGFTPYANHQCLTGEKGEEKIEMYTALLCCHGNVRSAESERENHVNLWAKISSTDRIKWNSIMTE